MMLVVVEVPAIPLDLLPLSLHLAPRPLEPHPPSPCLLLPSLPQAVLSPPSLWAPGPRLEAPVAEGWRKVPPVSIHPVPSQEVG